MIDQALEFVKSQLNRALKAASSVAEEDAESERDLVEWIDGEKTDPLTFSLGTVSMLLVNIEQEKTMRRAEPHRRVAADNTPQRISPEIRLELSVLFVAQFKQYSNGLKVLSNIVQYFQEKPLFSRRDYPQLPADIERLAIELQSMPLTEQNEVWSALRVTYRPSLLYRVRMLVFKDRLPRAAPQITEAMGTAVQKRPSGDQK